MDEVFLAGTEPTQTAQPGPRGDDGGAENGPAHDGAVDRGPPPTAVAEGPSGGDKP